MDRAQTIPSAILHNKKTLINQTHYNLTPTSAVSGIILTHMVHAHSVYQEQHVWNWITLQYILLTLCLDQSESSIFTYMSHATDWLIFNLCSCFHCIQSLVLFNPTESPSTFAQKLATHTFTLLNIDGKTVGYNVNLLNVTSTSGVIANMHLSSLSMPFPLTPLSFTLINKRNTQSYQCWWKHISGMPTHVKWVSAHLAEKALSFVDEREPVHMNPVMIVSLM